MNSTILILEDHPLYAAGLKDVAEQLMPDAKVICESTLSAGVHAVRVHQPMLIISDLHLPDAQGLTALDVLRSEAPDVLLIGITGDMALLSRYEGCGHQGTLILAKTDAVDRVFDTLLVQLEMHAEAERRCKPQAIRTNNVWTLQMPSRNLTRKQQAVLTLMGQGLSNKEIARKLQISPETVKSHAKSLYRQLGVKNRTQAAGQIRRLMRA